MISERKNKLKQSLRSRFAREIADINSVKFKERKEVSSRLISMQMSSMIQTTFRKVQKNQILPINPVIAIYISQFIRYNGFEVQLTSKSISKIMQEYEEFIQSNSEAKNNNDGDVQMKEENKQDPERTPQFVEWGTKDEGLEALALIHPDNFKLDMHNPSKEEPTLEAKTHDYYYPRKMEDIPPIIEADVGSAGSTIDHEIELLHSFFPANGVSDAIEDAKNFLISHKFVTDENDIDVVRGPFAQYEAQVIENMEYGDNQDDPTIIYVPDKQDEEFNRIADMMPQKFDFPAEGQKAEAPPAGQVQGQPQGQPQGQSQMPPQAVKEPVRKPEERLAYEKPSRDLPWLIDVKQQKLISIEELLSEMYSKKTEVDEYRKLRKRTRINSDEELKISFDQIMENEDGSEEFKEQAFDQSNNKKAKIYEEQNNFIDITEEDNDMRK